MEWPNHSTEMLARVVLHQDQDPGTGMAGFWTNYIGRMRSEYPAEFVKELAFTMRQVFTGDLSRRDARSLGVGTVHFDPPREFTEFAPIVGVEFDKVHWRVVAKYVAEKLTG